MLLLVGAGGSAKSGGGFDLQQREIFEKRRLELVALGKVSGEERGGERGGEESDECNWSYYEIL